MMPMAVWGAAEAKVKGGKLVRVKLAHDGERIEEIRITGDFFVHPEEGLESIEKAIVGLTVAETKEQIQTAIEGTVAAERLLLIGFTPSDLASLVEEALL